MLNENCLEVLEDSIGYTIHTLPKDKFEETKGYGPNNISGLYNINVKNAYWFRCKISNRHTTTKEWYLVSYNYTINEIDVFVFDTAGALHENYLYNERIPLSKRVIATRHPIFPVLLHPGDERIVYIRIKNDFSFSYAFLFADSYTFISKYLAENYWYGAFYGLLFFALIFSLFSFRSMNNISLLVYMFVIFMQAVYMMFRDGTAVNIILREHMEYADTLKNISCAFLSITLLMYVTKFFEVPRKSIWLKIVMGLIGLRLLLMFVHLESFQLYLHHFEFFIMIFCIVMAFMHAKTHRMDHLYMILGMTSLLLGFIPYYGIIFNFFDLAWHSFFDMYFGIVLEVIFITLALFEQVKQLRLDSNTMEQANLVLESVVQERTEKINIQNKKLIEKSDELSHFLYRVSHDIKGPLKSIEGLCNIGEMEEGTNAKEYFGLIKDKISVLGSVIKDLSKTIEMENSAFNPIAIDFNALHTEVVDRYSGYTGIDKVHVVVEKQVSRTFYADYSTLVSIYQNLFENAVKYRDESKTDSFLRITILVDDFGLAIDFEDNGIGIDDNLKPIIFEMFIKGSNRFADSTGLGLYMVKKSIERMGGNIKVKSTLGAGATFSLFIPHQ